MQGAGRFFILCALGAGLGWLVWGWTGVSLVGVVVAIAVVATGSAAGKNDRSERSGGDTVSVATLTLLTLIFVGVAVVLWVGVWFTYGGCSEPLGDESVVRYCDWIEDLQGNERTTLFVIVGVAPLIALTGGTIGISRRRLLPVVASGGVAISILVTAIAPFILA